MPNPFSANVNQDIVDQAQQDQLLNAAMKGDAQARSQLLQQIRGSADPYHQQFIDYQEAHGGITVAKYLWNRPAASFWKLTAQA